MSAVAARRAKERWFYLQLTFVRKPVLYYRKERDVKPRKRILYKEPFLPKQVLRRRLRGLIRAPKRLTYSMAQLGASFLKFSTVAAETATAAAKLSRAFSQIKISTFRG